MPGVDAALASIDREGYAIVRGAIPQDTLERVTAALPSVNGAGIRGLLARAAGAREVLDREQVRAVFDGVVGAGWRPVRSILFDKTSDTNWGVPRHRDTTIAVRERRETPGFGPWSVKDGVHHVRPPDEILGGVLTLRAHLDPADSGNGALIVWPGSHADPDAGADEQPGVVCEVAAGDAVFMRPLLAHASRKAPRPSRRRVIHVEAAAGDLPGGLEWTDA